VSDLGAELTRSGAVFALDGSFESDATSRLSPLVVGRTRGMVDSEFVDVLDDRKYRMQLVRTNTIAGTQVFFISTQEHGLERMEMMPFSPDSYDAFRAIASLL
jgi:hypothetical protein